MNLNFKKDILPHVVAIIVFAIVVVLFYSPMFLSNKDLRGHDVLHGFGSGQEIIDFRESTGEEALWTNSMFGGMPSYLINTKWSGDLLAYVQKGAVLGFGGPALVTMIAFISFYILLVVYGVRPYLAIGGALAYGLNSFNMVSIEAGHIWKVIAIGYMPLVVAGFKLLFDGNGKKLWGFVLVSLALALEIRSNHLQITYYLVLLLIPFGLSTLIYSIKDKKLDVLVKNFGLLLLAVLLAITCNFGKLWATYEYGNFSTRGKSDLASHESSANSIGGLERDYVFNWSSGKMESMTLLVPNFHGGASVQPLSKDSNLAKALKKNGASAQQIKQQISQVPTYWGDQPGVAGPIYLGAVICFLFVLGAIVVSPKHRNWLLAASLFSILLSWGKNLEFFNYLMYDYFPGYDKFRSVSMAVVIALLTMPLLGFLGLEKVLSGDLNQKNIQKKLLIAFGATGGLCLLIVFFSGMGSYAGASDSNYSNLPDWFLEALRADRVSLLRTDAMRSFSLILLFALVLFAIAKDKLKEGVGIALALLLVLGDLWFVDRRYINEDNFSKNPMKTFAALTAADREIKKDESEYRVLNLQNPWNESKTSYNHHSIGGYHGAKPGRYQDLIEFCLDNQKNEFIQGLQSGSVSFEGINTLNMLNTKYLVFGPANNNVIQNPAAFGNAWLASNIKLANSADEEISMTCNLSSKNEAVIDASRFKVSSVSSSEGSIELINYKPNQLTYRASVKSGSLALFSEMYYDKGWKAYVDGSEVPIIRANYVLRALELPKGDHSIEFKFMPQSYIVGNKVMLAGSSVLILLLLASIGLSISEKKDV